MRCKRSQNCSLIATGDGVVCEPSRVVSPWQLAVGAAYRFGPTRWNQKIGARWRDERYVISRPIEQADLDEE